VAPGIPGRGRARWRASICALERAGVAFSRKTTEADAEDMTAGFDQERPSVLLLRVFWFFIVFFVFFFFRRGRRSKERWRAFNAFFSRKGRAKKGFRQIVAPALYFNAMRPIRCTITGRDGRWRRHAVARRSAIGGLRHSRDQRFQATRPPPAGSGSADPTTRTGTSSCLRRAPNSMATLVGQIREGTTTRCLHVATEMFGAARRCRRLFP